jgi:hypothetical protein
MPLVWSAVIGLAAFRLYRIVGVDDITEPFHGKINAASTRNRLARWINELISCPWCVGFWFALAITAAGWWLGAFTIYEAAVVTLAASAVCGLVARTDQALEVITGDIIRRQAQTGRHVS